MDIKRDKFKVFVKLAGDDGVERYFIAGKKAASATLTTNNATNTQADITQTVGTSTVTKGSFTYQLQFAIDDADVFTKRLLIANLRGDVDKVYECIAVSEYIHDKTDEFKAFTLKFDAKIPLATLGGDGQANMTQDLTITGVSEPVEGVVDMSQTGPNPKYDTANMTFTKDAFVKGIVTTNFDAPAPVNP